MKISGNDEESKAVIEVARLLLLAARTAPKAAGKDDIESVIVTGKDKDDVAKEMREMAETYGELWIRDAVNVEQSSALVLIGLKGHKTLGINCGACGHETCSEFSKAEKKKGVAYTGPICTIKALDLGVALGSAAKTAQIHNVDNRIFYRAGAAAVKLNIMPDCPIILCIPLSATGKSVFFDR
ncbi:MAG: ferredoxin domain-containing protein [Candidatus Thorarchaeota archaeon]